ncbi:MAG: lasso peptide [Leptolyngbya sp. SIO1E4]|nr:lasso peptide [Leptolyngbya sp. SIO1E4]
MKKGYTSPKLTVHGSVEQMTKVLGPDSASDVLIFNGETLTTDSLSDDLEINIS